MLRRLCIAAFIAIAPAAHATTVEQMEANKKAVAEFYEFAVNKKDFEAAAKFLGPRYVQHNPNTADGPEGSRLILLSYATSFPTHIATSSAFSPTATTSSSMSIACRHRARAAMPS
jgi:hypothetical protein